MPIKRPSWLRLHCCGESLGRVRLPLSSNPVNSAPQERRPPKMTAIAAAAALLAVVACSETGGFEISTVLTGLDRPTGIAIQPETGHLFIAESAAARVIRVVDAQPESVVVDFPVELHESEPAIRLGPLSLLFLDRHRLLVGGGGLPDGDELLRVYNVPPTGTRAIPATQMATSFSLPATGANPGEGDFFGLASTEDAIFVTSHGDDTKGWLSRLDLDREKKLGDFLRFAATTELSSVGAPGGIAISPLGGQIAVAQMGAPTEAADSLLVYFNQRGKLLLRLELGLHDVTSLAYGPTGQLYAADLAWAKPSQGGLFQLVATLQNGVQGVRTKKLAPLEHPTAMVFDKTGVLYITVLGSPLEDEKAGKLLKVTW